MTLTQKSFLDAAGDRSVLWINPGCVRHHTGTKWPVGKHRLGQLRRVLPKPLVNLLRPVLKKREPFLIPAAHFGKAAPVEETERYIKVTDFIAHEQQMTSSVWYRSLMQELEQTGCARHKSIEMRNETEILDFLTNYVAALITSLRTEGYQDPQGGFESTAVINHQGEICKAGSGNHRFNMSRALGLKRFPLRIVAVHENWFAAQAPGETLTAENVLALLKPVETSHR